MRIRSVFASGKRVAIGLGVAALLVGGVACSGGEAESAADSPPPNTTSTEAPSGVAISTSPGSSGAVSPSVGEVAVGAQPPEAVITERVASSGSGFAVPGSITPAQIGAGQQTGIWVNGRGQLDVEPDIATLSMGVEARAASVADARQSAAAAMEEVLDTVKNQGVEEDDVETTSFRIQPQITYREIRTQDGGRTNKQEITGYIVTNQVQITIRDLENVGTVVDAAAGAAGDLVRINHIGFSVEDPSQYGEQLRRRAAEDAKAKAQIYADAMGVQLGPLVFLSEQGSSAPTVSRDFAGAEKAMAAEAPRTPIQAGDMTFSAQIQAVFAIASS